MTFFSSGSSRETASNCSFSFVIWAALVFGEEQQICTDAQSHGHLADDFERWLRTAALATVELHHVHADPVGQSLPG